MSKALTIPRVLVVDDDLQMLRAFARFLGDSCEVVTVECPVAGLELLRFSAQPVHIIFSDFRMPKMWGDEFLRRAKEISPVTMCVLMSGGATDQAMARRKVDEPADKIVHKFLYKPFSMNDALALIREAASHFSEASR